MLESEGGDAGFVTRRRLRIAPTRDYVGSDVVVLEAA
jgi:hypothetical protein